MRLTGQNLTNLKTALTTFPLEYDELISFEENSDTTTLTNDDLTYTNYYYDGDILKSNMQVLIIEAYREIPKNTIINYKRKIWTNATHTTYELVDYGNFNVIEIEKKEDTNTYKMTCYDDMIKSMVDYVTPPLLTYPVQIGDYFETLCNYLGIEIQSKIFTNSTKVIQNELYANLGYKFRDVFDEISKSAGSSICINLSNKAEVKTINTTNDTINEDFLNENNINVKEKFGPINSIVLSRSAGSDNVFIKDDESIAQYGLCEIKISDNQIMNFNDRSEYLQGIANNLFGLEFYQIDISSSPQGIMYYEFLDKFNLSIGEHIYSCVITNNDISNSMGLSETIESNIPNTTQTDYSKASETDKKINQTNLIVDKQKGRIDALVESTQDLTNYINVLENDSELTLTNTMTSNGAINYIEITNFSGINKYPGLEYPSNYSYPGKTTTYTIVFTDSDNNTKETYLTIGINLISTDKIIVRQNSIEIVRQNQTITLERDNVFYTFDETTKISLKGETNVHIKCEYIIKNDFTTQFALQGELGANIIITDSEITSKVSKGEIISSINQSAEQIQINANKISLEGKEIDLTSDEISINSNNFKVTNQGILTCNSAELNNALFKNKLGDGQTAYIEILSSDTSSYKGETIIRDGIMELNNQALEGQGPNVEPQLRLYWAFLDETTTIGAGGCYSPSFTQTSREEKKKDFEKFEKGIETIKNIDIYKYHLKGQMEDEKKHIGFVIGDNYKYSKEVTDVNEQGADIYSFVSVCCKAIQEQQQIIENLQKEMEEIRNGKN